MREADALRKENVKVHKLNEELSQQNKQLLELVAEAYEIIKRCDEGGDDIAAQEAWITQKDAWLKRVNPRE